MACLIIGPGPVSEGLLLETDLGNPLQGLAGFVTLFKSNSPVVQFFIGFSSAKHNTQKYLQAIHKSYHRYLQDHSPAPLTVHCHNWKSGIGKVIISDIIKLTQPVQIFEFYSKSPHIESVLAESCSFLEGSYHKPKSKFNSIKVTEEKSNDFKADRSRQIMKYFGVVHPEGLCEIKPKVCFIGDVEIRLNGEIIDEGLYRVMVGKVVGLCEKESDECVGIGLIRDFNQENGMLYLVSPVKDLDRVDCLEIYSGEGSISLQRNDIFSENLAKESELDIPYVLSSVILAEKVNKYHPSRSLGK